MNVVCGKVKSCHQINECVGNDMFNEDGKSWRKKRLKKLENFEKTGWHSAGWNYAIFNAPYK